MAIFFPDALRPSKLNPSIKNAQCLCHLLIGSRSFITYCHEIVIVIIPIIAIIFGKFEPLKLLRVLLNEARISASRSSQFSSHPPARGTTSLLSFVIQRYDNILPVLLAWKGCVIRTWGKRDPKLTRNGVTFLLPHEKVFQPEYGNEKPTWISNGIWTYQFVAAVAVFTTLYVFTCVETKQAKVSVCL